MAAILKLFPMDPAGAEAANLSELLRSTVAPQPAPAPSEAPGGNVEETWWTAALDFAVEAADAIQVAEERIANLEAQKRELESYLEKEVRALQARIKAADRSVQQAEARSAAAETRAERAEQRAERAETCLSRIRDQLSPIRRTRAAQVPAVERRSALRISTGPSERRASSWPARISITTQPITGPRT